MASAQKQLMKAIGPAPIQDPFRLRLNLPPDELWGKGYTAGAVNTLAMVQDPATLDGTLYAGSVSGGVWMRTYNGASQNWGRWRLTTSSADYQGAQSIAKISLSSDHQWLIAGLGGVSSYLNVHGEIKNPLLVASREKNGELTWLTNNNPENPQEIIKGLKITALSTIESLVIIGTNTGLYTSMIQADGSLATVQPAGGLGKIGTQVLYNQNRLRAQGVSDIAIGRNGRIFAAVIGQGVYTATIEELKKDPSTTWQPLPGSAKLIQGKINLKLSTSYDQTKGREYIYIGSASEYIVKSQGRYESKVRVSDVFQTAYASGARKLTWKHADVAGRVGSNQADWHFSFYANNEKPGSVYLGGNFFSNNIADAYTGGLLEVIYPAEGRHAPIRYVEHYASATNPSGAGGSSPHADSRSITSYKTGDDAFHLIQSDDGGVHGHGVEINSRDESINRWYDLNDGLNTAECLMVDWSSIGKLAITALQDNAVSIIKYGRGLNGLNQTGGDGGMALFDDAIFGNNSESSRAYFASQYYSAGNGFMASTYDSSGSLRAQEWLSINVIDEYGNVEDYGFYDVSMLELEPTMYNLSVTSQYRAGDTILTGARNAYEQYTPWWTETKSGEFYAIPILPEVALGKGFTRAFTATAIGSQEIQQQTLKPMTWDAGYIACIEMNPKTRIRRTALYARTLVAPQSTSWADYLQQVQLKDITSYLPLYIQDHSITSVTFNPSNPKQVWITAAATSILYGAAEVPATSEDYSRPSYVLASGDGGLNWSTVAITGTSESGLPANAYLQQIAYRPSQQDSVPAELYVSGYGGVWQTPIIAGAIPSFSNVALEGFPEDRTTGLWFTELKYDPQDDVLLAGTMGHGVALLNPSNRDLLPTTPIEKGIRAIDITLPQNFGSLRSRKNRSLWGELRLSLDRTDENKTLPVTVDLVLDDGWDQYISLSGYVGPAKIINNRLPITFPAGVNDLSIYVNTNPKITSLKITQPDINIAFRLENATGANIIGGGQNNIYLYATGETLSLNQTAPGVFYSNQNEQQLIQALSILMPRAVLDQGTRLYWYPVDTPAGEIAVKHGNSQETIYLSPSSSGYATEVRKRQRHLATSSLRKNTKALSPEKAALAFDNPDIVDETEGIAIGTLGTSLRSGLVNHKGHFAFALEDKSGKTQSFSPINFSINEKLDNVVDFSKADSLGESQVVMAPGKGDLYVADESIFSLINTPVSDRIRMNIDLVKFTDDITGFGIYRVDDSTGNFYYLGAERRLLANPLRPGSLPYAKEALRRANSSEASQPNSLDGVTGLNISETGKVSKFEIDLATGNYYGTYITPGTLKLAASEVKNLSQILFSIQDANAGRKLAQISMGTGYFCFEDFKDKANDYNEFMARLTPKVDSVV